MRMCGVRERRLGSREGESCELREGSFVMTTMAEMRRGEGVIEQRGGDGVEGDVGSDMM